MKSRLINLFLFSLCVILTSYSLAGCDDTLPAVGVRDDVLIIVNDNSLDSCEVGKYYAEKRNLGQNNIVHVATRPRHLLTFPEFRILMDQIIKYMQENTLVDGAPPAPECIDNGAQYWSPYYCQASMTHLRQYTKIRYLVMTRGVPTRSRINGSMLLNKDESASIDNYLSYWLVRYFSSDIALNFLERERAFGDGRGMRIVEPAVDGELIVGRIDGVDLASTKALVDRTIDAEANGLYGKHYGSKFGRDFGTYTSAARWFDYNTSSFVYGTSSDEATGDSWRYQLGIFGEARPECLDYLAFSRTSVSGKAPQDCNVRFSETPPGQSTSRTPIVDDALIYLGQLHGQASGGGSFSTVLNWVRNPTCSVKLCEDDADPAACRAASTDVFKEINTSCVGVADGFIGYNYQSYPVAAMAIWPTGYRGNPYGGTNGEIVFPEVRTDTGRDDNFSLWFTNKDTVVDPKCYSNSDFSSAPTATCRKEYYLGLYPQVTVSPQAVNSEQPQQYQVTFWFRAANITDAGSVRVRLRVHEPDQPEEDAWVDYDNQTVGSFGLGDTGWTNVQATFQLDPTKHTQADLMFDKVEVYVSTDTYIGEVGLDDFSIREMVSGTELITNPTFADGHKEVSGGDHAATYLSRLNGVAFWGSLSHHESGGHAFNKHPQETMLYFLRGLPLGDAVWWGENHNSGMLYGDPLYSPAAVRFEYLQYDALAGVTQLSGTTINGRDPTRVSTVYEIDYCPGDDFYICDQDGSWQSTGLAGVGGQESMLLGAWDSSAITPGTYTLRLKVTSTNPTKGRSQSLYDYYPITIFDPIGDEDGDGLSNGAELSIYGANPTEDDTDADGLFDGDEVNVYGTDPVLSDSDSDDYADGIEVQNGGDPLDENVLPLAITSASYFYTPPGIETSFTVTATWEDASFYIENAPAGLVLDSMTGEISWVADYDFSYYYKVMTLHATHGSYDVAQTVFLAFTPGVAQGDINADEVVNAGDIIIQQRIYIGKLIPTEEQRIRGDMDNDREIGVGDLLLMQKQVLGL